ncbi:hypothetical protein KFU94_11315 [Chloroflexi bacterium TSY]|nr:hypothetical protein [Chloroflexi bacterium TSY]
MVATEKEYWPRSFQNVDNIEMLELRRNRYMYAQSVFGSLSNIVQHHRRLESQANENEDA